MTPRDVAVMALAAGLVLLMLYGLISGNWAYIWAAFAWYALTRVVLQLWPKRVKQ